MSIRGNSPASKTPQAADYSDLGKLFMRNDGLNRQLDIFKNGFINGAFDWNQRGQASYTAGPATYIYTADRWGIGNIGSNGSMTATPMSMGLGDAANGSDSFHRIACTGHSAAGDGAYLYQPIENVRRFAGKRCVLRGMCRRVSGAGNIYAQMQQGFGTGGSADVLKGIGGFTPSMVWAPFALIVDVPPLSAAQVLGPQSFLNIRIWISAGTTWAAYTNNLGLQTLTVDFAELEFKEIVPGYGDQYPGFERLPREIELLRSYRYYEQGVLNVLGGGLNQQYVAALCSYLSAKRVAPSLTLGTASTLVGAGYVIARNIGDGLTRFQVYYQNTSQTTYTELNVPYTAAAEI